MKETNSYAVHM